MVHVPRLDGRAPTKPAPLPLRPTQATDEGTLKEQGIEREPQIHVGPKANSIPKATATSRPKTATAAITPTSIR
jgi:hypothetical protein